MGGKVKACRDLVPGVTTGNGCCGVATWLWECDRVGFMAGFVWVAT